MSLSIQRLRLETDRLLRSRAFFARAVLGRLRGGEYAALLDQLAALIDAVAPERARDLVALGRQDVALLSELGEDERAAPCPTIGLVKGVMLERLPRVSDGAAHDLALAVLGTSWVADAAASLERPFPGSTRLLNLLAAQSAVSLERLEPALRVPAHEAQDHLAFAEFVRGSLLGLSGYLDSSWPASCVHGPLTQGAP